MDLGWIAGAALGLVAAWLLLLVVFWLLRPRDVPVREVVRVIPSGRYNTASHRAAQSAFAATLTASAPAVMPKFV